MRYSPTTRNTRHILCVFPAYTPSFGTFQHAYHLFGRVRAFMPPQGLLVIAAYCLPETNGKELDPAKATSQDLSVRAHAIHST